MKHPRVIFEEYLQTLDNSSRQDIVRTARKNAEEKVLRGEKHGRAKLTEAEAREIRTSGMSPAEAYKAYPHCKHGAYKAAKGETWKHLNRSTLLSKT